MNKLPVLLIAAIFIVGCGQNTTTEETSTKPNILLLVGDDIAFGDLSAYGSEIATPNMNSIADAGV